jgi:hypothetical protein
MERQFVALFLWLTTSINDYASQSLFLTIKNKVYGKN